MGGNLLPQAENGRLTTLKAGSGMIRKKKAVIIVHITAATYGNMESCYPCHMIWALLTWQSPLWHLPGLPPLGCFIMESVACVYSICLSLRGMLPVFFSFRPPRFIFINGTSALFSNNTPASTPTRWDLFLPNIYLKTENLARLGNFQCLKWCWKQHFFASCSLGC